MAFLRLHSLRKNYKLMKKILSILVCIFHILNLCNTVALATEDNSIEGISGSERCDPQAQFFCFCLGFALGVGYRKKFAEREIGSAEQEAKRIIDEIEEEEQQEEEKHIVTKIIKNSKSAELWLHDDSVLFC